MLIPEPQNYMRTLYVLSRVLPFILSFRRDVRRWIVIGRPARRSLAFHKRRAERLVATIAALGPSFVKIAQVFAGRADLLPEPYLSAVSTLTDRVPPVPVEQIERVIHEAYGRSVTDIFTDWSRVPLASASLGQVHRARYLDVDVVVKVLRPNIERTVESDVKASAFILRWAERFFPNPHVLGLRAIIGEFAHRIGDEMDFRKEAQYAERIRTNFAFNPKVAVPIVFDELTRQRVLVLEYMPGTRIDALAPLIESGKVDTGYLVRTVMELYVQMMLVDGFFHADPHPGNLLWGDDGRVVLLDFGLVVDVPKSTRLALVRTVFAAIKKDAGGVVDGFYALGLVQDGVERSVIVRLVETLLGIAFERTTTQERIEFVERELLANQVLETIYDFPIILPSDMVYFARTAALIEGLGTRYDARFNALLVVAPIAMSMRREILSSLGELDHLAPHDPLQAFSGFLRAATGIVSRAARELSMVAIEAISTIQPIQETRSGQSRSTSTRQITNGAVNAVATVDEPGSGESRT
jgi:predicted unusual protein kinase regulating ubiquinone biosynthesis (AarF/ABC1/UbiB family)